MTLRPLQCRAAASVAIAVLIVALANLPLTATPVEPIGVTTPVEVTTADSPTAKRQSYSAPSLVAAPDDPKRLYAAAVELRSRRCVFFRSTDAGKNWEQPAASPSRPDFPFCTHTSQFRPMTSLAMGRGDAIYYLHQGWAHQDEGEVATTSVFLARSTDGGTTWSVTPVHDARRLHLTASEVNYPIDLAVHTRSAGDDVVYASWTATYPGSAPARPSQPMLAVSDDGGTSFSRPFNATGDFFDDPGNVGGDIPEALKRTEHFGGRDPDLAVDGDGNVYVAWVRTSEVLDPVPPHPRYLSRSSDRGATFGVSQLTAASPFPGPGPVLEWSAAGGAIGSLHVVYEDKVVPEQGDRDVLHRRSTDGGATWGDVRVVNDDDPVDLFAQLLPNMSVAADGRVDVSWWDQRAAAGRYAVDLYSSSSADGGATWSRNRRLTEAAVDRGSGTWVEHNGDTRQPPAIASSKSLLNVVWDEPEQPDGKFGVQTLRAAALAFASLTPSHERSRRAYGLAMFAGVLLGVLVSGRIRRHRSRTKPHIHHFRY